MTSSAISPNVTTRLNEIVGAANVASDFAQLATYEIDRKLPAAAVRPATSEEVAEIVKFAAAEKLSLVATGARTKLGIGYAPTRYDLALDMTRLNKVIAYDPGDLTLSVEAGIPLAKLAGSSRTSPIPAASASLLSAHHSRRRHRFGRGLSAAPVLRHRPRFPAGHGICHRRRDLSEKRWPRGEKCRRLRHPQIDDRRSRHPRGHHPLEFQDLSDAARASRLRRTLPLRRTRPRFLPSVRAIAAHPPEHGNFQPPSGGPVREPRGAAGCGK